MINLHTILSIPQVPIQQGLLYKDSLSGAQATYEEIMETLANLAALKIRGKFSNVGIFSIFHFL